MMKSMYLDMHITNVHVMA